MRVIRQAPRLAMIGLMAALAGPAGCQSGSDGVAATSGRRAAEPPPGSHQGGMTDAVGAGDGNAVPLKAAGISSRAEMTRDLARLDTPELKSAYETGFRFAFSSQPGRRNFPEAARLANQVISERPGYAPAYRLLGYALLNTNRAAEALDAYQRAVGVDPDYGEAHYALAFMYAMGDRETGRRHLARAMELGIKDERDLAGQFYAPTR